MKLPIEILYMINKHLKHNNCIDSINFQKSLKITLINRINNNLKNKLLKSLKFHPNILYPFNVNINIKDRFIISNIVTHCISIDKNDLYTDFYEYCLEYFHIK
jgi:hypothetical protein